MLRAIAVAFMGVSALLAAGAVCGVGDKPAPTTEPTVEPAVASDELGTSVLAYSTAEGLRVQYKLESSDVGGSFSGEVALREGIALYARLDIDSDLLPDDQIHSYLFLPPDLYGQQGTGAWFVQSPWDQGTRPSEQVPIGIDEPIIYYEDFVAKLFDVEPAGAARGLGEATYSAKIRLVDLARIVTRAPQSAEADVTISLDEVSRLPKRVVVDSPGVVPFHLTVDFDGFGEVLAAPDAPVGARPFRDANAIDAPCRGPRLQECLAAETAIVGADACDGTGRRVCLVPIGSVPPQLMNDLLDYYRQACSLPISILKPVGIPAEFVDQEREQVDAIGLIEHVGAIFPADYADPDVVFIGLTFADLYDYTSHYRYVFGQKGTFEDPKAILSTFRMDPVSYGDPEDDAILTQRFRKMLSKYIGLLYYDLPPSDDTASPMYDSIGGLEDLDGMTEPLPVCQ